MSATNVARGQTGKHLRPPQCVRNIESSFATTLSTLKFTEQEFLLHFERAVKLRLKNDVTNLSIQEQEFL